MHLKLHDLFRHSGVKKLRPHKFTERIRALGSIFNEAKAHVDAFEQSYNAEKKKLKKVKEEVRAAATWAKRMKKNEQYLIAQSDLRQMTVPQLKTLAEDLKIKRPGIGWPTCCPRDGLKEHIVERCLQFRLG